MAVSFGSRLKHAWNAFLNKDPTEREWDIGTGYTYRPDRPRFTRGNERTIVTAVYNRIAIDCASIDIRHVRVDDNKHYLEDIESGLNYCFTTEANIDQTGRAFVLDVVMSLLDEGCVVIVPVDTSLNPSVSTSYDIHTMRTGKILDWYVKFRVYNDRTGQKEDILIPKTMAAIIENPLYSIMNEPNSTLQRLIRKLSLLDVVDEETSSGKLNLIVQLPYIIKTDARRQQAEKRRKDIEEQLAGSKYGIAYTDGTEHITQLGRPLENNLMGQIEYLTSMLYSQLGITQSVMDGTADEKTMLNYYNRTVEPIVSAVVEEVRRKFLTKTARSQRQTIMFFRDPFKLVPINNIAEIADKFTRNEILTSNEVRQIIAMKPSEDPMANVLRNKNISQNNENPHTEEEPYQDEELENSALSHHGIIGQKWGVWNEETRARRLGEKVHSDKKVSNNSFYQMKNEPITSQNISKYLNKYKQLSHVRVNKNTEGKFFIKNDELQGMINVEDKDGVKWIQGLEIFGDSKGKRLSYDILDIAVNDLGATNLSVNKNNKVAKHIYDQYGFKTYKDDDYMYYMKIK